MKLLFVWGLLLGLASPAFANNCYYFRDLPKELKKYRSGDQDIYETQGTMVIPKAVAKCSTDICVAWVMCDNGAGAPTVKTKVACRAKGNQCPTANDCFADEAVMIDEDFKVAESKALPTRSLDPANQEGVE